MAILRTEIEKALDELISNEEGMRFQGLAVVLAKQKWPELIASERKKDLGLDAYAPASLTRDGKGRGLACSTTAKQEKIQKDIERYEREFSDVEVLIFATAHPVTNHTKKAWADAVRKAHGVELIVVSREDIIADLTLPQNGPLCRTYLGIPVAVEPAAAELLSKVQEAVSEEVAGWLSHPRLAGKPKIELMAVKLDQEGRETGEFLDLRNSRTRS